LRIILSAIQDGWHFALAAQAAARTLPMRNARLGVDDKRLFHELLREFGKTPRPRPGAASRKL